MSIVIFGSFIGLIEVANKHYDLIQVVCEKNKINKKLLDLCKSIQIQIIPIEDLNDFEEVSKANVGICYGFGKKIPKNMICLFQWGIVNFHPGDLRFFRGRHPIGWALIEQKSNLILTSHLITQEFDLGFVIQEKVIYISESDTEFSIIKKVESAIISFFLISTLKLVCKKHLDFKFVKNGRYLPSLANKFNKISSLDHDSGFIIGLLRAKYDYGGIKINGTPVLKAEIINSSDIKNSDDQLTFMCSDDRIIRVVKRGLEDNG